MAKYSTNSLGFKLNFDGPGTVEEFDQKAGKVGACLEGSINDELYRGTLPEWQDKFGEYLETMFGKRGVNQKATAAAQARAKTDEARAKVKDVPETWTVYKNRVTASLDDEAIAELAAKAQEFADATPINPAPTSRSKGLTAKFRVKAESLLTLPEDQLEAKITTYLSKVDGFELDRDEENRPTVESLGRLVEKYIDALMAE